MEYMEVFKSYLNNEISLSTADIKIDCDDESHQLLLHSGLLHLENIIYNMR